MSTCKRMWTDREIRSMADESAKIRIEAGQTENAKPLYWHTIRLYKGKSESYTAFDAQVIIINNTADPIDLTAFTALTKKDGFYAAVIQGYVGATTNVDPTLECVGIKKSQSDSTFSFEYFNSTTKEIEVANASYAGTVVTDLGTNKLN